MIKLIITMTGKSFSPKAKWNGIGEERKSFADKAAAMQWLDETYGKAKRAPMYVDAPEGAAIQIGYVIGFRSGGQYWLQQDWIEFRECKSMVLDNG